ncbi:MAG: NAD(P)-dependent oxidoreductase [bacterium]|nr:NAD(P)-dependent oxidoreductase [bacterium]
MNLKNKKIIVTGGAGVIGRELVPRLVGAGAVVRCIDIAPKPKEFEGLDIEYSQRDLSYANTIDFLKFDPEIIFHLAAVFERTKEEIGFWDLNFQNEVMLNHNVFTAARECKNLKKFVFASSYLIYDFSQYLFPRAQKNAFPLREDIGMNPRNLCGATKLYAEKELEYLSRFEELYKFKVVSARIFRVYGRGSGDVISRWVRAGLGGEKSIEVFMEENRFDYIYAGDVADALLGLSKKDNAKGIVNIGTGKPASIKDVVNTLKGFIPSLAVKKSSEKGLFEASVADTKKLRSYVSWKPLDIKKGVKLVIAYEKEQERR